MQSIIDFILEIDRLKTVTRKIRVRGEGRFENSAEHSWQLALLAYSLQPYAPKGIDIHRVIQMLLIHDIGEIDTGDTLFFIQENLAERKRAEQQAVTRIFQHLSQTQASALLALWHEFESGDTEDARFAHAVDRAIPIILNLANEGQSWRENHIGFELVVQRVGPPIERGCPALWDYLHTQLIAARAQGLFEFAQS